MSGQNGELKLVISLKGDRASVGVQAPECDPLFFGIEGDLGTVLSGVPGFVEEARRRWETNKLYPECESPLPSQAKPAAPTRASTAVRSRGKSAQTDQTLMF
jgi:hypothetical protein